MYKWLTIAAGGALGSTLRYALQAWDRRAVADGAAFPLATLLINVTGCLAIGALAAALAGPLAIREEYRLGLTVGLLGGFTTFSTFGFDTFNLAVAGQFRAAAANVILSCLLGIAAVWLGYRAVERALGS